MQRLRPPEALYFFYLFKLNFMNATNYVTAEKEEMSYLTKQPNVLLTPHIAGYSAEAFYKMSAVIIEKLEI